ncbi:bifunctional diaminohydroxyphosphoribosylaminopyrimidine deaminase/5-amino-6-(5-phosphoribosylamino)uracil reductase RibD [Sphingomonas sp. R-74633]|uniref:bifunctional diaminohydroxyphosphoribosylaminopyrimidine deaminase/5-amino-6-(5-phosphoribosylamino)uracil reductase RibD n=1 Tax=Sphingomonas sp. R-74633 TaxID=2751188 RepID=UPI0015D0DC88|nr:bifunctional diaminohydroxyphosphoribosylaminopyrimidine deaminase/5-amino-6-(5-phosphoribosylamino)uracil reductase RibD [Sphingomonas sp. R-74633]NYT41693.1 bifunctional diaminohydroxyphosphoribosylaminopyrimidine deaminase/5-amino-6-(5-phosphoribosylamino)uracil reductase RibD [Sphingomonas sp. R-74633]
MGAALALAERGRGRTAPNPNVGCVIVRDGVVVGRGWTQPGGRPHAEAKALAEAGEKSRGATVHVTLEPCAHASARGPACSNLLIEAGVARVVIALGDPDPRTNGAGAARLRAAGIDVTEGVRTAEARRSMAGFLTRLEKRRPFVTLKLATSLDGQIALASGESQWITGAQARAHTHLERARHEAILVGRRTMEADNPRLDVRLPGLEDRSPRRLTLSSTGDLKRPEDIATLEAIDHLFVEGGAETAASFLRADLVDRLLLYRAPILIGAGKAALGDIGLTRLGDAHGRWKLQDSRMLGSDRMEVYERA